MNLLIRWWNRHDPAAIMQTYRPSTEAYDFDKAVAGKRKAEKRLAQRLHVPQVQAGKAKRVQAGRFGKQRVG